MKVTDERDCCEQRDLLPYRGTFEADSPLPWYQAKSLRFCKHCGQLWSTDSVPSPAGDSDTVRVRCFPGVREMP